MWMLDVMTTQNFGMQDLNLAQNYEPMIGCLDTRVSMNTFSWIPSLR